MIPLDLRVLFLHKNNRRVLVLCFGTWAHEGCCYIRTFDVYFRLNSYQGFLSFLGNLAGLFVFLGVFLCDFSVFMLCLSSVPFVEMYPKVIVNVFFTLYVYSVDHFNAYRCMYNILK